MTNPARAAWVYTSTLLAFLAMDAVWIQLVAMPLFKSAIGGIMRPEPMIAAAIAFYLIYTAGLVTLAINGAPSSARAAAKGAVLGLTAYATFDLTNLAIINGWTWALAVIDIAWGTALSAIAAAVGSMVARR